MAEAHQVECEVDLSPELAFGVFANAFRLVDEEGNACLLEFLVYSTAEQKASVPITRTLGPAFNFNLEL